MYFSLLNISHSFHPPSPSLGACRVVEPYVLAGETTHSRHPTPTDSAACGHPEPTDCVFCCIPAPPPIQSPILQPIASEVQSGACGTTLPSFVGGGDMAPPKPPRLPFPFTRYRAGWYVQCKTGLDTKEPEGTGLIILGLFLLCRLKSRGKQLSATPFSI